MCAVCCLLGAHYAGAESSVVSSLERYGRHLGIAFQIADDLLDILGNERETGKSLGSDFAKQKLTLPLIRLIERSAETDAARVRELLSIADAGAWSQLLAYVLNSDAIEYSRAKAQHHAASARECLQILAHSPAKVMLAEIAEFATQRTY